VADKVDWLKRLPWKEPNEEYPGQNHGLPRPGTPESKEYHRRAWEREHPHERKPDPASREASTTRQKRLAGAAEPAGIAGA
jgi:hypothetical protein